MWVNVEVSIFMIAIFEKSNNARIFRAREISIHSIYFFAASKITFLPLAQRGYVYHIHSLAINANDACAKFTYFPKHFANFTISSIEREKAHTLKLRFQRQNNRSLWPMLPNRFRYFFWPIQFFAIEYGESQNGFRWYFASKRRVCLHINLI